MSDPLATIARMTTHSTKAQGRALTCPHCSVSVAARDEKVEERFQYVTTVFHHRRILLIADSGRLLVDHEPVVLPDYEGAILCVRCGKSFDVPRHLKVTFTAEDHRE